jgi:hypothetical protein
MGRGRKPKLRYYPSKNAWFVTVDGKRYRIKERPPGWSDEDLVLWVPTGILDDLAGKNLGPISDFPPTYSATPAFVRLCMPARGRHALSFRRCQRVAKKLEERYGPDELSLMDADVTDERDWEGAPVLRGLSEGKIVEITRDLYEQDREATAEMFPQERREKLPQFSPRSRGRRTGYVPGGVRAVNNVKQPRPQYRDNGETATADPPEQPKPKLLDPISCRQRYVSRAKREILERLDRAAVTAAETALERQRKIRRGQIQVTSLGDCRTVAFPRPRRGGPTQGVPPHPEDDHKPTEQEKIAAQMEEYRERDRLARERAGRGDRRSAGRGRLWNRYLTKETRWAPRMDEQDPDQRPKDVRDLDD